MCKCSLTVSVLSAIIVIVSSGNSKLDLVYQWKYLDFTFSSPRVRQESIDKGTFIPGNAIPIDVDTWQKDGNERVFVAIPRFHPGIPATLATVSSQLGEDGSPLLAPYPSWDWHKPGDCSGIQSVFRVKIDQCGRLWVLDTGVAEIFTRRDRLCQPRVMAFSLDTDQMSGRHTIPESALKPHSLLTTIQVEVRDPEQGCADTFAYIADVTGFGIVVFDARRNRSWRVESRFMYPYPPWGHYKTNGVEFDLMDGVLGMAVSPLYGNSRWLYFHSLSSLRESWVLTDILRNETNFKDGINTKLSEFMVSPEARTSQAAAESFDKQGNLYFSLIGSNSINCWHFERPYKSSEIDQLAQDDVNLQFVAGVKVVENRFNEEELWVLSDRFQLAMVDTMDNNEVNFRVLKAKLQDLNRGSKCKPSKPLSFPNPQPPPAPPKPNRKPPNRPYGYGYGG